MTVTVVNGEAGAGDRVAYATREGNRAVIRLGTIVDIITMSSGRPAIKVMIEAETSSYFPSVQKVRRVENLDRVVVV